MAPLPPTEHSAGRARKPCEVEREGQGKVKKEPPRKMMPKLCLKLLGFQRKLAPSPTTKSTCVGGGWRGAREREARGNKRQPLRRARNAPALRL